VEADIHANRKVPANRRRINEAFRSGSIWVALVPIKRPSALHGPLFAQDPFDQGENLRPHRSAFGIVYTMFMVLVLQCGQ
jgi:hypothetical protein